MNSLVSHGYPATIDYITVTISQASIPTLQPGRATHLSSDALFESGSGAVTQVNDNAGAGSGAGAANDAVPALTDMARVLGFTGLHFLDWAVRARSI